MVSFDYRNGCKIDENNIYTHSRKIHSKTTLNNNQNKETEKKRSKYYYDRKKQVICPICGGRYLLPYTEQQHINTKKHQNKII